MAVRSPLVIIAGQVQQLPSGDTVSGGSATDPPTGTQAPGSFTIATGKYGLMAPRLTLTTSQRATLQGTARLSIRD